MAGPGRLTMSNIEITIYHNPRCSKSRETLKILTDNGHAPVVVEYLKTPPSAEEIQRLLDLLSMQARDLIRTGEAEYIQAGLDQPSISDQALIRAINAHPILLQRPIVVRDDRAVIGRPPEKVLELLD